MYNKLSTQGVIALSISRCSPGLHHCQMKFGHTFVITTLYKYIPFTPRNSQEYLVDLFTLRFLIITSSYI